MATPATEQPRLPPIAGQYAVLADQPLPAGAGGGLPVFAAADRRDPRRALMAVQVRDGQPMRAQPISILSRAMDEAALPNVLGPIAHGPATGPDGRPALFVICPAPPGPALWPAGSPDAAPRPWPEAMLLTCVLRPAVEALASMQERQITHRAIRPDNLFQAAPNQPVVLGCAWAAPPASQQPALLEPPANAMCLPAGRGDGTTADDVYALGVTLLLLALGACPLLGQPDALVIRRKLELGSYEAILRDARIPPLLADLTRAMLAEDPDHRPTLAMLRDPSVLRGRRISVRAYRRAQRPLEFGGMHIWDTRTLAYAIAREPSRFSLMQRSGELDVWLRRGLCDTALANRLEELGRSAGKEEIRPARGPADLGAASAGDPVESLRAMRAVAVLDPLAPLCFAGAAIWPDGLGPALAACETEEASATRPVLQAIVTTEAIGAWAALRPTRCDIAALQNQARQHHAVVRKRGWSGGLARLRHVLNPLLPCRSRTLRGELVMRAAELVPVLDHVAAATPAEERPAAPIDRDIAAFLAAHQTQLAEKPASMLGDAEPATAAMLQVRLLTALQTGPAAKPAPALAAWCADLAEPALRVWRNVPERERRTAAVRQAAQSGKLADVLELLDDPLALDEDRRGAKDAAEAVRRIDRQITDRDHGSPERLASARRLGEDIAGALGLTALAAAAVGVLL